MSSTPRIAAATSRTRAFIDKLPFLLLKFLFTHITNNCVSRIICYLVNKMATDPRTPPTHRPANTYEPYEMANLKQNADTALEVHLLAAADYITEVLVQNQVSYALMGGLSLRLRGSTRGTQDVDIAVGCNMNRLLEVIRPLES